MTTRTERLDRYGAFAGPEWTESEALARQKRLYIAGLIPLRDLEQRVTWITEHYAEGSP